MGNQSGGKTSNYEMEIDAFKKNFSSFWDKNIVLYGIGRHTATLVPAIKEFHIVGLMDRDADNVGKHMYGIPIISVEEAEEKADVIVINTAETYWDTIYKRISGIKVPVYYPNGVNAVERAKDDRFEHNLYWRQTMDELQRRIAQYEVISFDLFDTLIMRRVFMPQDVFKLVEKRVSSRMGLDLDFYRMRLEAGQSGNDRHMLLEEIYAQMNQTWRLQEHVLKSVRQIEIETEIECCVPREDMVELFNETVENKLVYLLSDMYLSSEIIKKLLCKCGLKEPQQIWISGEKKKSKRNGELWECFSRDILKGRKALHIGDNEISDNEIPRRYGIDTYYVMSGACMWEKSSLGHFAPNIQSLEQSVFAGLLGAKMFNSPFALCESKGLVRFSDFWLLGYCLWGGIMYSFLVWMVKEARARKLSRLVFFARDGYLIKKQYDFLKELQYNYRGGWPDALYLAISRRIAMISSYSCEADLDEIIDASYHGTFSQYMYDRFDILISESDENADHVVSVPGDAEKLREWLSPYREQIIFNIQQERDNYLSYVDQYNINEQDGVIDLWFNGRNQYYLSKIVGRCLTGFYFTANLAQENECCNNNVLVPCFQAADDVRAEQSSIMRRDVFVESFLTAPYGMIKYLDEKFNYICAPDGANQKNFDKRNIMNQGVCDFMRDYLELMGENAELSPQFADCFFGEFVEGHLELNEQLKNAFNYDNAFVHRGESKIFD